MKIAVFGTPQFAADIFETLREQNFLEVSAAITMPNKRSGRGKKEVSPPVAEWASKNNIPVFQPQKANKELVKQLIKENVEVCIFLAYGSLVPKEFLDNAPNCWNLHLSVLPELRGASPVQQAILEGKETSGVTVFQLVQKMDAGDILGIKKFSIKNLRANEVYSEKIFPYGSQLLIELLYKKSQGEVLLKTQQNHSKATFCGKVEKKNGFLEPENITAEIALRKINAYFPWPGTSVEFKGKRLKILKAQKSEKNISAREFLAENTSLFLGFQEGSLELVEVQPEGKKPMSGADFARGYQI